MAKLVMSINGEVKSEYPLNKKRIKIGRKASNDIRLDNLGVSGNHALIVTILEDSFLEDLGSTNGSYVNGKLIKKHALKDGDIIAIGKHELKYVVEPSKTGEDEFERTMVIKPGTSGAAVTTAQVSQPTEKTDGDNTSTYDENTKITKVMPLAQLTVLDGPIIGKTLKLTKALITLGKPGTQVAVISRRPNGYFLTHIDSDGDGKRYPLVNGQPIGPDVYSLKQNDVIELAGVNIRFSLLQ